MFSPDEVVLNQKGMLSERQERLVVQTLRYRQMGWGCAILAFTATPAVILLIGIFNDMPLNGDFQLSLGMITMMVILLVGITRLYDHFRTADLRHRRIRHLEGEATTYIRKIKLKGGNEMPRFELTIQQVTFFLPTKQTLLEFDDRVKYRVYYISNPPPHILLSAERLENGQAVG